MTKVKTLTKVALDDSKYFVAIDRPLDTQYFAAACLPFSSDAKIFASALSLTTKYDVLVLDNNVVDPDNGPDILSRFNAGKEI